MLCRLSYRRPVHAIFILLHHHSYSFHILVVAAEREKRVVLNNTSLPSGKLKFLGSARPLWEVSGLPHPSSCVFHRSSETGPERQARGPVHKSVEHVSVS